MTNHTGVSYNDIALRYAQKVDSKPMHMYYERPAVLSLLPPLVDSNVLDVGCGSGWYAEYLLNEGATVTAFDFNQDFVALTQIRVGARARVLQADLAKPLDFAGDATFDVVICPLVMHYLHDWQPAFREFYRVLKLDGVLVFSTHHPFNDWQLFEQENYFAVTLLDDEWEDIGKVQFYRRPLTKISEDLAATGFVVEHLLEPQPTEEFQKGQPDLHERLSKNPCFLVIRARKGL
ncbi:MAG: class I SAM-dependent methyltransferase [Chloroflexota bacterium]